MSESFRGGQEALVAGLLEGSPDLRAILVTEDFTAEPEAEVLSDFADLGEFDGSGYQRLDLDNVDHAYDSGTHTMRITADQGEFNASMGTVSEGTKPWEGILYYLHVDGTDANDIPVRLEPVSPGNGIGSAVVWNPPSALSVLGDA